MSITGGPQAAEAGVGGVGSVTRHTLFREVMFARDRVYRLAPPTPVQRVTTRAGGSFWLKREDLSPIHSYKWRGAFNRMCVLRAGGAAETVVAASAGNHAQGVAAAARRLQMPSVVFMPVSTPRLKVREVARLGGEFTEIVSVGDSFEAASEAAAEHAKETGAVAIPPYDDLHVMAGQGTIGDEIVTSAVRPRTVYVQIGGGGLAAGVACVLRTFYPDIRIVGVEAVGQASMAAAVRGRGPVALEHVDGFCDGTAVRCAGRLTFPLCAELIDEFVTVTNDEVCAAIEVLWNACRLVPEPSGALGVAALLKREDEKRGSDGDTGALAILSGANMDFPMLSWIGRHGRATRRRYYRFEIDERPGSLIELLDAIDPGVNICDFQYGKVDRQRAFPVIGFEGDEAALASIPRMAIQAGVAAADATHEQAVDFRLIPMRSDLFRLPYFAVLDFPERPGALRDFMRGIGEVASICYFNYATTGQTEGHALMGFEFAGATARAEFLQRLAASGIAHKRVIEPLHLHGGSGPVRTDGETADATSDHEEITTCP